MNLHRSTVAVAVSTENAQLQFICNQIQVVEEDIIPLQQQQQQPQIQRYNNSNTNTSSNNNRTLNVTAV